LKIAILTGIKEWNLGYSVVGIVQDQVTMLKAYGHDVTVFVPEIFCGEKPIIVSDTIPDIPRTDYQSKGELSKEDSWNVKKIVTFLEESLEGFDFVFTHDLMFVGWHLPYALAIKQAKLPNIYWWHWVHSTPPRQRKDWWDLPDKKHKLIIPNQVYKSTTCGAFQTTPEQVRTIPHIKDLRTFFDFDIETLRFIKDFPAIMQANLIQIYPAACDRLTCKQVDKVIMLFGAFKRRGVSVCLVIANQWATTLQRKEDTEKLYALAEKEGLIAGKEFIFTSDWDSKYETGIPRKMLRELLLCANFFAFPSMEESFGLVGPEAALSGNFMVLNKNLSVMSEVFRNSGFAMSFGSWESSLEVTEGWEEYLRNYSGCILSRMSEDETFCTRSLMRRLYNYDSIYKTFYDPLMQE